MTENVTKPVSVPLWVLVLLVTGGAAGPVLGGVTLASQPDLEIVRLHAIQEAVAAARAERHAERQADNRLLEERLGRIEDKIDALRNQRP